MKKNILVLAISVLFAAAFVFFYLNEKNAHNNGSNLIENQELNNQTNFSETNKPNNSPNPKETEASSNIPYLNEIALKIINREVVPDTYFVFIENEALIESITNYNRITGGNRISLPSMAIRLLEDCYDLEIGRLELASAPANVRGIVEKVIHYSQYKNTLELMQGDADFAQTFYRGDTPDKWNEQSVNNPWTRFFTDEQWLKDRTTGWYDAEEYWAAIDSVTAQLKEAGAYIDNKVLIDQILNREVIRDTCLNFIDDPEIVKAIQDYNKLTAQYIFQYTPGSITQMITQSELQTLDPVYKFNYFDRLDEVERFSAQIAKYALYGNCSDLIYAMPGLVFDRGSGVGQWPRFFQQVPPEEFEVYLNLVDALIVALK